MSGLTEAQAIAIAEIEKRRRARRAEHEGEGLLDFIVRISPLFSKPKHLAPIVERIEASLSGKSVWMYAHAPPRHAKTETLLHAAALALKRDPTTKIAYVSYAARIARRKSGRIQALARKAGVRVSRRSSAAGEWQTEEGGGVFSAGRGGPLTGEGFNYVIVDDPYKNRAEAESQLIRNNLHEWYSSTVVTRLEPGGSIWIAHTRWHPDDLAGRLEKEGGYDFVTMPAVDEQDRPLWPSRWPRKLLDERRKKLLDIDWWSLFQGKPRPRGGAVFEGVAYYRELPTAGIRKGAGLDFAYTVKTASDSNTIVEGVAHRDVIFITYARKLQAKSHIWRETLKVRRAKNPSAPWVAFVSGTEKGVVDLLNDQAKLKIQAVGASTDKLMRAQSAAIAWNDGRILLPDPEEMKSLPWVSEFITEIASFTGLNDDHDDYVDGLSGLVRALGMETDVTIDMSLFAASNLWDV